MNQGIPSLLLRFPKQKVKLIQKGFLTTKGTKKHELF